MVELEWCQKHRRLFDRWVEVDSSPQLEGPKTRVNLSDVSGCASWLSKLLRRTLSFGLFSAAIHIMIQILIQTRAPKYPGFIENLDPSLVIFAALSFVIL